MICGWVVAGNVVGVLGVILLAVPAWHVARYALLMARLSGKRDHLGAGLDSVVTQTMEDLEKLRDSWGMRKFSALIAGTLAAGLSYILPLIGLALC
jgi:uncharacterized membrane protein